jgi:hypothetical protein
MSGLQRAQFPEVDRIVAALDVLLDALDQVPAKKFKVISVRELLAASPIEGMLTDPINKSLRLGLRLCGERLHHLGGTQLMHEVLDRVCDLDPAHWSRRASRLDHGWNGIGVEGGHDFWVS